MDSSIQHELKILRADFNQVRGCSFDYFYCPILFKDENVPLCKAHIVNQAFPNSAPDWTVQRRVVDNFYGAFFEADFLAFHYHEDRSIGKTFTDKILSKRFNPKIMLNDRSVDYFFPNSNLPDQFTRLNIEHEGQVVQLGLKMSPKDVSAATDQKWEVVINKDIRITALVSLIKAAHLTLFEMLSYRYALSAGSHFIGRQVLGEFFYQNYGKPKPDILENAYPFFREFTNLVRPLQTNSLGLQGTITDKLIFLCGANSSSPWAIVVFVKTSNLLHAVLIPVLEHLDAALKYMNFLKNDNENIEVSRCRLEQGQWNIDKQVYNLTWPKKGILYP